MTNFKTGIIGAVLGAVALAGCSSNPEPIQTTKSTQYVTETKTKTHTPAPRVKTKTKTETATATVPGPTVTVASRSRERTPVNPAPNPVSTTPPANPTSAQAAPAGIASCIAKYESGGNPVAENPSSTASGLYQFLDTTWQAVTGLPGRAKDYPVSVQTTAFYKLWDNGAGANQWVTAHNCI